MKTKINLKKSISNLKNKKFTFKFFYLFFISGFRTYLLSCISIFLVFYLIFFENQNLIEDENEENYLITDEDLENKNPVQLASYHSPINPKLFQFQLKEEKDPCFAFISDPIRQKKFETIWKNFENEINENQLWNPDSSSFKMAVEALENGCIKEIFKWKKSKKEWVEWIAVLEGNQKVILKIVWEGKGDMKRAGLCGDGFENPSSEISAFHLNKILNLKNTPPVAGRTLDIVKDIYRKGSSEVINQIKIFNSSIGLEACIFGVCRNCISEHITCPHDNKVQVSMTMIMNKKFKKITTLKEGIPIELKTRSFEESPLKNLSFCLKLKQSNEIYENKNKFSDIFDFIVFDYLTNNHYSTHKILEDQYFKKPLTVRTNFGRSFCAYDRDEDVLFLTPLTQCCKIRKSTYDKLLKLKGGEISRFLRSSLSSDPLHPVLRNPWFPALQGRLRKLLKLFDRCINKYGIKNVFL